MANSVSNIVFIKPEITEHRAVRDDLKFMWQFGLVKVASSEDGTLLKGFEEISKGSKEWHPHIMNGFLGVDLASVRSYTPYHVLRPEYKKL